MTINYTDAIDAIYKMFEDEWSANAATIGGLSYTPEIRVTGVEKAGSTVPTDKYWCRFSFRTLADNQSSITNADRNRLFTTRGLVFIQIFGPVSESKSFRVIQKLAHMIKKIYRNDDPSGNVWFRDPRVDEQPPTDSWNQINVIAEYRYDELEE